ncbi:MAG: RNA-directed DNA polymerase [Pseudomonadota bacterium]|nr:RNA-directed DNA polymerase [Pseudomonadota bacterium]
MTMLTDESLEFAKEHITKYYDSDFFPKPFEFDAIWFSWAEVKKELTSRNINKLSPKIPNTLTSMKPKGGFRVVHQLDPLDTIIYTAMAYMVALPIEQARISLDQHVACSYRFEIANGSFFSKGNGFVEFSDKSELLAKKYKYILTADITDFYNQIYLHRLNNAIACADNNLVGLSDDIEKFISKLNSKASQGIPVGPAASIVMAEAIMIDIDEFLREKDVFHTRYVDDFRIYSDSKEQLVDVLEDLTLYLYTTHRLTLVSDKTKILESEKYISEILHNQYQLERVELFHRLEILNSYSGELDVLDIPIEDEDVKSEKQLEILIEKVLEKKTLDLGMARALFRKAKKYNYISMLEQVFDNFEFFVPVINDLCLYLRSVTNEEFVKEWKQELIQLTKSTAMDRKLVRFWFEWYVSTSAELLDVIELKKFVYQGSNIVNKAQASITSKNISWVRTNKNQINNVGNWERRAIVRSTQILAKDEREPYLNLFETVTPEFLDKLIAKWVKSIS